MFWFFMDVASYTFGGNLIPKTKEKSRENRSTDILQMYSIPRIITNADASPCPYSTSRTDRLRLASELTAAR